MKKRIFLACLAIAVSLAAIAQERITPKAYVNGLFFESIPTELFGEGTTLSLVRVNDSRILRFQLADSTKLTDEIRKRALPEEKIENLEAIKQQIELLETRDRLTHGTIAEPAVGEAFPDFRCRDIDDKEWSNADLVGKVAVLNVWYSGCAPCIKEMPILSQWKENYPSVVFLAATFHDKALTRELANKYSFNWNQLCSDRLFTGWIDGKGYPLTIVIDKNGKVRYSAHGTNEKTRSEVLAAIETCVNE